MISFRTRDDSIASVIAIIAILMLAGTLGWMIAVKKPTEEDDLAVRVRQERNIDSVRADTDKVKASIDVLQKQIDRYLWAGTPEDVGPKALAAVTAMAKARNLRLIAFRPQKPVVVEGLTQVPFGASISGSFLSTMQFVKDLETSKSKLAVTLVQVTAADAATDQVSGTVNVVAYLKAGVPTPSKPTPAGGQNAQKPK